MRTAIWRRTAQKIGTRPTQQRSSALSVPTGLAPRWIQRSKDHPSAANQCSTSIEETCRRGKTRTTCHRFSTSRSRIIIPTSTTLTKRSCWKYYKRRRKRLNSKFSRKKVLRDCTTFTSRNSLKGCSFTKSTIQMITWTSKK
jgi:hypothetical protein